MIVTVKIDINDYDLDRFKSWIEGNANVLQIEHEASDDQKNYAYSLIETASNVSTSRIDEYMKAIETATNLEISEIIDELKGLQIERVASQEQINKEIDEALKRDLS